jgi:CheY-like chemotaxis protein
MKRILIVDDDRDLVQSLTLRCQSLGYEVIAAFDGLTALQAIHTAALDVVCLDVEMPEGNGLRVAEMVAADPRHRNTTLIIVSAHQDEATRTRCQAIRACYVHKSPNVWNYLAPLLRQVMKLDATRAACPAASSAAARTQPKVLVIGDNAANSRQIHAWLQPYRVEVVRSQGGLQGFWRALAEAPDLIVLAPNPAADDVVELLDRLRCHARTVEIPVIEFQGEPLRAAETCTEWTALNDVLEEANSLVEELARHIPLERHVPQTV